MKKKIAVLLASYNGEDYIEEQILSVLNQTDNNWHLVIRDDGSTDKTLQIEKRIAKKYPEFITVLENKTNIHGPKSNFLELTRYALKEKYEYIMFCDQDDFWKKDKIKHTFELMCKNEINKQVPVLVHTDLEVVDEKLNTLGKSFFQYRALNSKVKDINHLLVQNNVTGCTMMVNRSLVLKAFKNENLEKMAMHDWWFTLVASVYGKIAFLNESTIKYRQHGGNVVGATKVNTPAFIWKRLMGKAHVKDTLMMAVDQAKLFLDTYNDIPKNKKRIIEEFSTIYNKSKINRIKVVVNNKILKQGKIQIIGELIFI